MSKAQITIFNNNNAYLPLIEEGITWETQRKNVPGVLRFKVLKDSIISFTEGDAVKLSVDGKGVFYGFIFTKSRDKDHLITVTAYDQLRYFKNTDTYRYENKTAASFIKQLAGDFKLNTGTLEDTGYVIPKRIESDTSLFDMVQNALDETLIQTNKMYVLFDDCGKLTLKNIESMRIDLLITDETAQNFSYESSIDKQTYNRIKIVKETESENEEQQEYVITSESANKWGILQYTHKMKNMINLKETAQNLLSLYDKRTRTLSIDNVFGDIRVRAGVSLPIYLNIGDMILNNYMIVESVKHTFKNEEHFMDLTLRGGEFIG